MSDLIKKEDLELQIQNAEDINQLKQIDQLFKLSRLKKEMLRLNKWESLQDKIIDTAYERVNKNSAYIRNDELLNFLKATQTSLDRTQKMIEDTTEEIQTAPSIQNNTVNLTYVDAAGKESRDRIQDAVLNILQNIKPIEQDLVNNIKQDIEVTKERLQEENKIETILKSEEE